MNGCDRSWGKKFRIPIILRDNYFLYGKLVPPPKKLNIPWDQLTENYGSSDYMILLLNGILYVTEITKWGPHNTQIIFKSDWKITGPQNT